MCKLVENATQLDIENSLRDGITQKQAQYRRIEGEKKIKSILVLDDYIEWLESRPYRRIDENLIDTVNYHVMESTLNRYPFDGGHFNVNVHTLLRLLNKKNLKRYCKFKGIETTFNSLLNVTDKELRVMQSSRTILLTLSIFMEKQHG
ncbi:hypothetical protein GR7B_00098 [Vibrio phage vB_VcorM_GR7B]|nr:hypothetical protein GR7B_00098 [Vibrio phage vB_VcorM_GR7B]